MSTGAEPIPDLPLTFLLPDGYLACKLIGLIINWGLQSILSVQVYAYYLCFADDPVFRKCVVCIICGFEWAQTILTTQNCYKVLVQGQIPIYSSTWVVAFFMPTLTAATVQLFLIWRITVIAQRRLFAAIIIPVVLTALISGILGSVNYELFDDESLNTSVSTYYSETRSWDVATNVWLWSGFLTDVLIIVFMVHSIRRHQTLLKDHNTRLNRIMRLVIETGSLTALTVVVLAAVWYSLGIVAAFVPLVVLSKVYANTMLATLNNRLLLRSEESITAERSTAFSSSLLPGRADRPSPPVVPMVIMTTTVEIAHDGLSETNSTSSGLMRQKGEESSCYV